MAVDCLAPFGGNVQPGIAVGGFSQYGETAYQRATSLVLTFILTNHLNTTALEPAMEWETKFLALVKNWVANGKPDYIKVAYSAERSIEDEIKRESYSEVSTIVISYVVMFVYISLALGSYSSWKTLMRDSKISLGLGGILIVLVSVASSLGIFGYCSIPTTLLVIEVIPFLVLAIGVDNMFIIVKTNKINSNYIKDPVECIAQTLKTVGPSIISTTFSEAACFAIGITSGMPAVKTFAEYGTVSLLVNFILQITVFVAFITLDSQRFISKRFDLVCCFRAKTAHSLDLSDSWIVNSFKTKVIPLIFKPIVRQGIVCLFFLLFCTSLALAPLVDVGLEQELSMPEDSYMLAYFEAIKNILSMGPPVYFVLKPGLNLSNSDEQNLICGGLRCSSESLSVQIYAASTEENETFIKTEASSWIDDFNDWITISGCCKTYPNGSFCPHDSTDSACLDCNVTLNSDESRPTAESFEFYLPYFLEDNPDSSCAKGGHAAYYNGVNYNLNDEGLSSVEDSYFMTYHTTLKSSADYYNALKMARYISKEITNYINTNRTNEKKIEVFPYSVFYVYYEQYLTIWRDSLISVFSSFAAVFIVTWFFSGFDFVSSLFVLLTVMMIVSDIAGLMYWWSISLNAITLVNLVLSIGISVEFCSHIVRAFMTSLQRTRLARAQDALLTAGSAVFSGITLTKFIGIGVLAFSKTQIFRVFYFRMYMGMVLFGAAHGLIFLPVLLSLIGKTREPEKTLFKATKNEQQRIKNLVETRLNETSSAKRHSHIKLVNCGGNEKKTN